MDVWEGAEACVEAHGIWTRGGGCEAGLPGQPWRGLVQPQGGLAALWPGPGLCQRGVTGATESCSQTYCSPWMPLVSVLSVTVIIFNCASNLTVHSSWGRGFCRRIPITGWSPSRRRTIPKEQTVSFRLVQRHRRRKALPVLILAVSWSGQVGGVCRGAAFPLTRVLVAGGSAQDRLPDLSTVIPILTSQQLFLSWLECILK